MPFPTRRSVRLRALALAFCLACVLSPAARGGDEAEAPPDEATLAEFQNLRGKLHANYQANLFRVAEQAQALKLYDDVRRVCDLILRRFPQDGSAFALIQEVKGKSSDLSFPDKDSQKVRLANEEKVRDLLKKCQDQFVRDCLVVCDWCKKAKYNAGLPEIARWAFSVQPDCRPAAQKLGYVEAADGGWILAAHKPLLGLLGTAVCDPDEAAAKKAMDELRAMTDLDLVELQNTIRHCGKFPPLQGRGAEEKVELMVDGTESDFYLRVPTQYKPEQKWGVYITLHPSEGKAYFWVRIFKRFQKMYENYIVVAPTLIAPDSRITWRDPKAVRQVDQVLKYLLANYNVDADRVFIEGFGIGCAALIDAEYTPDRYAGVVCRDRVYTLGKEPSRLGLLGLINVPVYLMLGSNVEDYREEDAESVAKLMREYGCPLFYRTIVGVGEDAMTDQNQKIFDWLQRQERDPFPRRVALAADPSAPIKMDRAYWLRLTDFSWKSSVEAEVLGDTIEVKCERVKAFELYLSDRFIDLDRPVKVLVNGKVAHEGKVERDLGFLLEHVRETRDRERTCIARLPIQVWKPRTTTGETRPEEKEDEPDEGKGRED